MVKKVGGNTYLLTVNSDKNPVKVSLSNLGNYKSAFAVHENRSISMTNGQLTDTFKPFDTHV